MSLQLERGTTDLPVFKAISQNLRNIPNGVLVHEVLTRKRKNDE